MSRDRVYGPIGNRERATSRLQAGASAQSSLAWPSSSRGGGADPFVDTELLGAVTDDIQGVSTRRVHDGAPALGMQRIRQERGQPHVTELDYEVERFRTRKPRGPRMFGWTELF